MEKETEKEIIVKQKPKAITRRRQMYMNVRNQYKRLITRMTRDIFLKEQLEQKAFKHSFNINNLRFEWEKKEQQKLDKTKFNKLND
jgi:hypothetical protein